MFLTSLLATGMFGILTMHLVRLVNYGHSYQSAQDLFELLKEFPLKNSNYHLFKPCRNLLSWPVVDKTTSKLRKLHLLEFDPKQQKAFGKLHSNVSTKIEYISHKKEGLRIKTIRGSKKNKCRDDVEFESWEGVIDVDNGTLCLSSSLSVIFVFKLVLKHSIFSQQKPKRSYFRHYI